MDCKGKNLMIGSWLCSGSPVIAESMAYCGFDFLTIDAEHSPVDIERSFTLLQAIKSGNPKCKALVRLPGNEYSETKRYMDAGADGVICPLINNREQAQLLVESVKYAPMGRRGVGFCRANNYGLTLDASVSEANNQTFVGVQIEHIDAINNLEDILTVEGIDAAIIGPYDLSSSMGITGEFDDPRMEEAIEQNLKICIKNNVLPGIHVVQPDPGLVHRRIEQGYQFIAYSVDITMITTLSVDGLKQINS